ncbi:MAG: AMP-binding protein [Rhabdochlamydiaceae bacterium]|nr:AMP-binding protein [Rhabdochlamydiaceae bacterium]
MLITDEFEWDYPTFEAYVEGMCAQIATFPSLEVPFLAPLSPLTILTLFACWKLGKIAFPLNPKIPSHPFQLFTPAMPKPSAPSPTDWKYDFIATYIQTSGSSGTPKTACHTLKNHVKSAQGLLTQIPLTETSCWGLTIPLYHVGGLGILFRTYLSKSKFLLSKNLERATHLSLVPTQLYRMLKENLKLPHLQVLMLGGAPLPKLQTPWNVLPTYGMTETSSQVVTNHILNPHAEMKISSEGEIWMRGEVLFQGYRQENTIHLPLNSEGWFETGDLGRWNQNRFEIIGRKDNLFISGGENIQPEEIEAAIRSHCNLEEAVIVPLKDEEFGARPAVFLKDPSLLPLIQSKLLEVLPKFKIPIRAFSLPEDTGLKLQRKSLQKIAQ